MDSTTIGLLVVLAVFLVLYLGRRNRRLNQED
jgi:hypothetical protein